MEKLMSIDKSELTGKLNMLKGIVPKKTTMEALQGVLVADGYLIANNMEVSAKVKLEAPEGISFIIPAKAFDLIRNYPDGELEIFRDGNGIVFKIGKIKNKFATHDPETFPGMSIEKSNDAAKMEIPCVKFLQSISRVAYAVSDNGTQAAMNCLCLRAKDRELNYIGLDGHIIAWDKIDYDGDFEMLIPKRVIEVLISIGLTGNLTIEYTPNGAIFVTEECEVTSRLVEAEYFNVSQLIGDNKLHTIIERKSFLEALTRAKMCVAEDKIPVRLNFTGDEVNIVTVAPNTDYNETVALITDIEEPLQIGFSAKLLIECLKAFDDDEVKLNFNGPKMPLLIEADGTKFISVILPVNLGGAA